MAMFNHLKENSRLFFGMISGRFVLNSLYHTKNVSRPTARRKKRLRHNLLLETKESTLYSKHFVEQALRSLMAMSEFIHLFLQQFHSHAFLISSLASRFPVLHILDLINSSLIWRILTWIDSFREDLGVVV